jgi:hypothetical protein
LIGDTDTFDQQVRDEEVTFALAQSNNNVYKTGAWLCRVLAGKYARSVDTEISGALKESGSQLSQHYETLADTLEYQAQKLGGLGIAAGGIIVSTVNGVRANTNRVRPEFIMNQFDINDADYTRYQ